MNSKKTQNLIVLIFLHILLLVAVYIFQGGIFPFLRFGGLVPLLFPVTAAGVALYEGRDVGGICGLFAGILCDVSVNQPVGIFTVLLTAIGLVVGALSDTILLSGFINYILCSTATLLVCAFVQMTPIIAVPNNISPATLLGTVAAQTLYSLAMGLPIWFFVRALGQRKAKGVGF